MTTAATALAKIPSGLRDPLLKEYRAITQNFAEHRWSPAELSGGLFCEIVYTIVDGFGSGTYASAPAKPANLLTACRALESRTNVPRSFQILIPRALPTLYEIRNNRGVGHVGGDVDANHMDATLVLSMCNWILAELVRVYHSLPIPAAQQLVDSLAERRIPLVWEQDGLRRVLNPELKLKEQILVLLASANGAVQIKDLQNWLDYKNSTYLKKALRELHQGRLVNVSNDGKSVQLLPPGGKLASEVVAKSETQQ
jgi:hypothetical protein